MTKLRARIQHWHWHIKQAGLYWWLFHIPWVRKRFKRATWGHYLGKHYGKAWKYND